MFISDFIGEATEYDKKLTLEEKKPKSWLKSVGAFANGKGGILFFGVALPIHGGFPRKLVKSSKREWTQSRRRNWSFMKKMESSLLLCGYCQEWKHHTIMLAMGAAGT